MDDLSEYQRLWGKSIMTTSVCECGADKLKLGQYGHSRWCPVYIAPVPITDSCFCGKGSWHSPLCKHRKEVPVVEDELKKQVIALNKVLEILNVNEIKKATR